MLFCSCNPRRPQSPSAMLLSPALFLPSTQHCPFAGLTPTHYYGCFSMPHFPISNVFGSAHHLCCMLPGMQIWRLCVLCVTRRTCGKISSAKLQGSGQSGAVSSNCTVGEAPFGKRGLSLSRETQAVFGKALGACQPPDGLGCSLDTTFSEPTGKVSLDPSGPPPPPQPPPTTSPMSGTACLLMPTCALTWHMLVHMFVEVECTELRRTLVSLCGIAVWH